jgi:hypothetical protein
MSPILTTIFFAVLGFFSLWSIMNDLGTGNATARKMTINVSENPGGFYLPMFCKSAFVIFSVPRHQKRQIPRNKGKGIAPPYLETTYRDARNWVAYNMK